jgi:hypothetical protein
MRAVTLALFWAGLVSLGIALVALAHEARHTFEAYDRHESKTRISPDSATPQERGEALYRAEAAIERWHGVGLYGLLLLASAAAWMLAACAGAGWGSRSGWIRAAVRGSIVAALGLPLSLAVVLFWVNGWQQFAMKWQGHEGPTAFLIAADVGALAGALIGAVFGGLKGAKG